MEISQKPELNYKSYETLIRHRIRRILMICSNYDAFIMEEDGRIESRIAKEYMDLNLSNPPAFVWANTAAYARELLDNDRFDMVICMYNEHDRDIFPLAQEMKENGDATPFILLMHYSTEIHRKLTARQDTGVDNIFSWHGNADLILAIIKLYEDSLNASNDILEVGVQAILLVEDSIRYYSTYLPELYKLVLTQSHEFLKETLNEDQQKNRKRSRPKILLATCYDEAVELYNRYKGNFLGIITDVGMVKHRNDPADMEKTDAGIDLVNYIRSDSPYMPILMQSSQGELEERANELNVGFLKKYSRTLFIQLSEYIRNEFGFGDFVFRDENGAEYGRATNLVELSAILDTLPDNILVSNTSRNMFSKWFFARGLFSLGRLFRSVRHIIASEARSFIKEQIYTFNKTMGRGIIAKFSPDTYADYIRFARLGDGSIGGKARGLAFMNRLVQKYSLYNAYEGISISIPRSIVVTTEYFDQFIEENGLQYVIDSELTDDEILSEFVASRLPEALVSQLKVYVATTHYPLAIRSSSKLEDSNYQPFAGVYSTYMIPYIENRDQMLRMLDKAIKSVYASAFYNGSRTYVHTTGNLQSEEKMSVIIQDICGSEHNGLYYPMMSGVARSVNFYPIEGEEASDGVVNVVYGLGKAVVEGDRTLRLNPKYPRKILQLSRTDLAMRSTQSMIYALDLRPGAFKISKNDSINFVNIPVSDTIPYCPYSNLVFSTYDMSCDMIVPGTNVRGPRIVSYDSIFRYGRYPVAQALADIMEICKNELMNEVEIEFAIDWRPNGILALKLLQVRPISEFSNQEDVDMGEIRSSIGTLLVDSDQALGTGMIHGMDRILYVPFERFDCLKSREIAMEIRKVNAMMRDEGKGYLLIGPGRWGSSVPSLGIPVIWGDISEAKMIVECGIEGLQVEPSQGTHFFQNITSLGVGYLSVDTVFHKDSLNRNALDALECVYDGEYVKLLSCSSELVAYIDRNSNSSLVGLKSDD